MKVRKITEEYRLDLFIIEHYGEYSEYYVSVLVYANPRVDFLNLKVGTKLKVPSLAEISKVGKVRGSYSLVGKS